MTVAELETMLAEHWDPSPEAWETFLTELRLDPEACGIFCGRLAQHALESEGVHEDDAEWDRFGPVFTTVALSAFEAALRLYEARPRTVPE